MNYWLIIDSWNLMETFITESLSPYNFYEKRSFGNDLTRFISKGGESYSDLVLYLEEPDADYAIRIDESILDASLISLANDKRGKANKAGKYALYPKTIYYQRGKVSFRFRSNDAIKAFIAESKIIIEVKTIDKYKDSFFVQSGERLSCPRSNQNTSLSFNVERYVKGDDLFNVIKGGVVGYTCALCTKASPRNRVLLMALNNLKNCLTGFHTELMINAETLPNHSRCVSAYEDVIKVYGSEKEEAPKTLKVIKDILDEIISLSMKRWRDVLSKSGTQCQTRIKELESMETACLNNINKTDNDRLTNAKRELQQIKDLEIENGIKEGKKRKYFPKGSDEYNRKQELKHLIEELLGENESYGSSAQLRAIREELKTYRTGVTAYDAILGSLFNRFSDNLNDMIHTVKGTVNANLSIDYSGIQIEESNIHVDIPHASDAEKVYFNLLANEILKLRMKRNGNISDSDILVLIENTSKNFKLLVEADSDEGRTILDSAREFWLYKNLKSEAFSIPNNLPLFQSVMAFFVKKGFDQIERFMMNRGYPFSEYAFMLYGFFIGYANMPKTLTNRLLSVNLVEDKMDSFLTTLHDN